MAYEKERLCDVCGSRIAPKEKVCPICGTPFAETLNQEKAIAVSIAEPTKKPKVRQYSVIILLVAVIVLLSAALIINAVLRKSTVTAENTITADTKLQALIDDQRYIEALDQIDATSPADADVLRSRVFEKMSSQIQEHIEISDYSAALALLDQYSMLPNLDQLQIKTEEGIVKTIEGLMDAGDYIDAENELEKYKNIPALLYLSEMIKYETIALACLYNLRPVMKNPNSLQANRIIFYNNPGKRFPIVVILSSGQNGFGGYGLNYSIFSGDDLSYVGSCSSLNEDDYDLEKEKDLVEALICWLINSLDNERKTNCDINRINQILSGGHTPQIDADQYDETKKNE